jgi:hypothetical protein
MISFILGLIVGELLGLCIMIFVQINRKDE